MDKRQKRFILFTKGENDTKHVLFSGTRWECNAAKLLYPAKERIGMFIMPAKKAVEQAKAKLEEKLLLTETTTI